MLTRPRLATLACVVFLALLPFTLFFSVTVGNDSLIPFDNLYQWEPYRSQSGPEGIRPRNHLLSDLILENYAWKQFIIQSLEQGELPLWNPYLFAGVPFLAAGQHSGLYPLSILYYVLPLDKAYGWFTVLNLALAGIFMFVFMRTLGIGRAGSTFAAVACQMSGFMIVSVVFQMIIAAAAWLPLILAMCERVIRQAPGLGGQPASAPWAFIGAVAIGMMFLAGHVEIMVYTALIATLYCVWRLAVESRQRLADGQRSSIGAFLARRTGWLAVMAALGVGIGAVQLAPLFELVQTSFRSGRSDFQQVLSYGFPAREALRWIMPNFFGSEAHHSYFDLFSFATAPVNTASGHTWWGMKNSVEGGAYVGILTLVFAGIATAGAISEAIRRLSRQAQPSSSDQLRKPPTWFFLALSFFSIAFIFGTPLYAILYYGLPGINQLHSPFRWIWALTLCLSALAGIGMQAILNTQYAIPNRQYPIPNARYANRLAISGTALIVLGLLTLAGIVIVRLGWPAFEPLVARVFRSLARAEEGFTDAGMFFSYQALNAGIFALALIGSGAILWLARRHAGRKRWAVLAIGLLVVDVNVAWAGFNPSVDASLFERTPPAIEFLKQDTGLYRITTYDPHGTKLLNANIPWLHGIQDIRGYDSIIPRRYTDYMSLIEPQGELIYNRIAPLTRAESLESPLLDLLNVKYVLTQDIIETPGFRLVYNGPARGDPTRIYQNERAMPRAFTLPITSSMLTHDFARAAQTYDPRRYAMIDAECGIDDLGCAIPYPADYGPAAVTVYKNNEVWVDVQIDHPVWLILTDSYFPGWRAFIRPLGADDDQEQEVAVLPTNGNFRAVRLEMNPASEGQQKTEADKEPASSGLAISQPAFNAQPASQQSTPPVAYTVRFKYSPTSFQAGLFATFVALVVLLFSAAIYLWRYVYRDSMASSPVRRVAKNSLVLTGFNLGARLIDMAFALLMLRVLGPEGAGKYYFAIVIVGWFEILTNFGLNTFLTREVARNPQYANRYLYNTSVLRLLLSLGSAPLVALVIAIWGAAFELSGDTAIAIVLLAISQTPSGLANGLSALFFAYEKAEVPAALTIVSALIKVSLGTVALLAGFGIIGLAVVSIVVSVITLAILFILASRLFFRARRESDPQLRGMMLRESFPLMLNHLLATLFFKVDVPMLEAIKSPVVVGWYSAAYKFVDAFNIIPAFFTQSFFPIMSRMAVAQDGALARAYTLALKLLVMIAFPLAVFSAFAATFLVGVLGGAEFLPHGATALSVMIWSIPFGWINSVTNYALIAVNQQRALTRAFAIGLAFNVVANLIIIPQFSYVGAAVTTILSEIVEGTAFYVYVRRHIAPVNWLQVLSRPALAALAMAAVTWLWAAGGALGLGLLYGIAAYALALWLLGALSSEERRLLAPLLPARFRPAQT